MKAQRECGRCCGKGYINAFGHVAGGICFKCMGTGFFVVNVAAERRKQAASDKRNAEASSKREANIAALDAVIAEMNAKFGPFNVETELGRDMLNCAVSRATGKDLYQHRAQRLAA